MTRCRFMTSIGLLVISMVMLTAMVVPHHHHWGVYCAALCEIDKNGHGDCHQTSDDVNHNHDATDCCNGCITKFCCPRPSLNDGLADMEMTDVWGDIFPVFVNLLFASKESFNSCFFYQNRFYDSFHGRSFSLRAPPFCS